MTVAMFVLRYDIEPVKGSWTEPMPTISHLVTSILPPDQYLLVSIVSRSDVIKGSWKFAVAESD